MRYRDFSPVIITNNREHPGCKLMLLSEAMNVQEETHDHHGWETMITSSETMKP
ncbi:MAG TPA: hypothetical protein HA262_17155 [Methanosarcina sp.]|nr:hypothetical protein [Methanosarcina sp.]